MGRAPCCDKANVKKGPWSPEEDTKLKEFIDKYGTGGNWIALPHKASLRRCGKSCRLRWLNYLRPNIKHGEFSDDEDRIICSLYASIGSRWSIIAAHLPGRTDNDIKNYWNTKLRKKLLGLAPSQKKPNSQQKQQQQFYQSPLEATSAPTSASPQSSFYTPSKPILTGFESGFSITTDVLNTLTTSASSTLINMQDPMYYYQMKDSGSINLMFGGEPSCSSSDGSCNQISYGKEIEYEFSGSDQQQIMGFESLFHSGGIDQNQRPLFDPTSVGGPDQEKGNGFWEEPPLDYGGFEDIKQMISTVNGYTNLLLDDPGSENRGSSCKTQGRVMYYY